jgi:NAD(P)-dependent dehydrogenase (short-subunit alcohol dehydrogenase family)
LRKVSLWQRFRLDGRRALVTGGSRGLGRVIATALAEAGAEVVIVGRDAATLTTARDELANGEAIVHALTGDVGTPVGAERLCEEALNRFARFDVLVNNVGGRRIATPTEELPLADWQRILDLNLTSALVCCQRLGRGMLQRGRGAIVNVGSIAAQVATRDIGGRAYETAKAALTMLTRALAADWAPRGVRVNALAPGVFETDPNKKWFGERPGFRERFLDMVPMGRLGDPAEIGPAAVFLASDAGSYVTGTVLVVDGGYTLW